MSFLNYQPQIWKAVDFDHLSQLANQSPVDIVCDYFLKHGDASMGKSFLQAYDRFLEVIGHGPSRTELEKVEDPKAAETHQLFQELRELSRQFQQSLTDLFLSHSKKPTKLQQLTLRYGIF